MARANNEIFYASSHLAYERFRRLKRSVFLAGSLMLVIGFIFYQFGLSSELHPTTLLGAWLAELAKSITMWGLSLEIVAVVLQFAGGIIAIFGLIICFAGVARSGAKNIIAGPIESRKRKQGTDCRFCGAEIEAGSSFCPKCNKSQN